MKPFVFIVSLMLFLVSTFEDLKALYRNSGVEGCTPVQPCDVHFLQGVGIAGRHIIIQKYSDSGTYIYIALFPDGTWKECEVYDPRFCAVRMAAELRQP